VTLHLLSLLVDNKPLWECHNIPFYPPQCALFDILGGRVEKGKLFCFGDCRSSVKRIIFSLQFRQEKKNKIGAHLRVEFFTEFVAEEPVCQRISCLNLPIRSKCSLTFLSKQLQKAIVRFYATAAHFDQTAQWHAHESIVFCAIRAQIRPPYRHDLTHHLFIDLDSYIQVNCRRSGKIKQRRETHSLIVRPVASMH
jgi:hypothetical protein